MQPLRVNGQLRDIDVIDLVRSLWASGETGVLELDSGRARRTLYFKRGQIVFASSTALDDRLDVRLLKRGRIRYRDLVEVGELVVPGKRFGSLLVEHGLLSPEELVDAVREQLAGIVAGVVASEAGEYVFSFGGFELAETIQIELATRVLIANAVAQLDQFARFPALGSGTLWVAAVETRSHEELIPSIRGVYTLLAEPRRTGELATLLETGDYELMRALWALSITGFIRQVESGEPAPARAAPQAAAVGPPEPAPGLRSEGPGELGRELGAFNDKHAYLYRVLKVEVGAGVDVFVRSCIRRAKPSLAEVFQGVALEPSGHWDIGRLQSNLMAQGAGPERLKTLLDAEMQTLMRMADPDRAAMIVDGLKAIDQRWRGGERAVTPARDPARTPPGDED